MDGGAPVAGAARGDVDACEVEVLQLLYEVFGVLEKGMTEQIPLVQRLILVEFHHFLFAFLWLFADY